MQRQGPPSAPARTGQAGTPVAVIPQAAADAAAGFADCPPGHRFGLYFAPWDGQTWSKPSDDAKRKALREVTGRLVPSAEDLRRALAARAAALARPGPGLACFRLETTAPFVTGVGLEHPLENGFSFAQPYGLPWLPGSSIKGVLRHAAERLALDGQGGWTITDVFALFGFEADGPFSLAVAKGTEPDPVAACADAIRARAKDLVRDQAEMLRPRFKDPDAFFDPAAPDERGKVHWRGALVFHDAIFKQAELGLEVMTPHQSDYYQKGGQPHDSSQPNPILYLVVPPGADLTVRIAWQPPGKVPDGLGTRWQSLIAAAVAAACDWHGFGAKTAIGYGAMCIAACPGADEGDSIKKPVATMVPAPLPAKGERIRVEMLAETTKKGGPKARHPASGRKGEIREASSALKEMKPGDSIIVEVLSVPRTQFDELTFKWVPQDTPLGAPPAAAGGASNGGKGSGRHQKGRR